MDEAAGSLPADGTDVGRKGGKCSLVTTLGLGSSWSGDTKVSDDFLDRLILAFFKRLELPNLMSKSDYHVLARCVPKDEIDAEIRQVLDEITKVAQPAFPAPDEEGR